MIAFCNEYDPDNILQSMWDINNRGGCLCTMRESCSWCEHSSYERRTEINKKILQQAKDSGYQLYLDKGKTKIDYDYVTNTYNLT